MQGARSQLPEPAGATTAGGRLWAVLINGGGSAERNYQSHVLHLRELIELLEVRGVPRGRITVFASDGADATPDLAVLEHAAEDDFWLIEGLWVGRLLVPEVSLIDTRIEGVEIRPARAGAIEQWLASISERLVPGDRLLFYVTDHGWKNPEDLRNNGIVLWGERMLVSELRDALSGLPHGVRAVMVMSQCFSGSFANVIYGAGIEIGSVCGYFSTIASRFAYGCYAENRGRDNVGHGFWFIEGLRDSRDLDEAHTTVLLNDRTPDVPLRTSDVYAADLLRREASVRGVSFEALVDEMLEQAWADEHHYAADFALIDSLGKAYGSFGPRSLSGLDERMSNLPGFGDDLDNYADRWRRALDDLTRENFDRFLQANPHWHEYVSLDFLAGLDRIEKDRIRRWLLDDLAAFTAADPERHDRLELLRTMSTEARAAGYRMQVRLGAALRMRQLLVSIAGAVYVDRHASDPEREMLESLHECERLELGRRTRPMGRRRKQSPPYPGLDQEMELIGTVLPGYLGVEFGPPDASARRQHELAAGAVQISSVARDSPAWRAGLRVGDIVLGPPGAYFDERNEIREWTLTSLRGEIRALDVLRDGRVWTFDLRIEAPPA